ncbi:MAG TPA: hypothetical protein VGM90_30215 [Kofleriaceae bacterium]
MKRLATLLVVSALGSVAAAQTAPDAPAANPTTTVEPAVVEVKPEEAVEKAEPAMERSYAETIQLTAGTADGGSSRGVGQDYVTLPAGMELTGQMRFVTSDGGALGKQSLHFTDVGLFDLSARVAVRRWFELSGAVTLLPKQPAYTDEDVFQHASVGARFGIGRRLALEAGGEIGPLLGHDGTYTRQSLGIGYRKEIMEMVLYGLGASVDGVTLSAPDTKGGFVGEVAASASVLWREPHGICGTWMGVSYAVPVYDHGVDPTTSVAFDAKPRLDFRLGGSVMVTDDWDLFAEFAVIDRGDLDMASTRLPIMDGGFDQKQLILGVTRHFVDKKTKGSDYALQQLAQR